MELRDVDLIEKFIGQDAELKDLWDEHIIYEKQLDKLENKAVRTPAEDLEVKEIKKKKLAGKTKIEAILRKYRQEA